MADEEPLLPAADDSAPPPPPPTPSWRIGAAFWILGLCNNLPYVVMLSAARDLLEPRPGEEPRNRSRHDCDPVGTGVSRGGRGPEPVGQRQRRGRGQRDPEQPGGSGLSYWSSGTGAAGLGGALGFWGLRALLPLPHALLPALALPPAMLLSFFFLLGPAPPPRPEPPLPPPDEGGGSRVGSWGVAKAALRLGAPLGLVYFAEYFVNQGLAAAPVPGRRLPLALVPALPPPAPPLAAGPGPGAAGRVPIGCRSCQSPPALAGRGRSAGGGGGAGGGGAYGNAFLNLSDQVSPPQQPLAVAVVTLMSEVAIAVAGGVALGAHAAFCGQE
ncbi:battenin isoform X5 [Poecile atricapillus]|uniref:battenin isoform X5 n=1 Tax=Poecile atricapillus TaxID=48891 RepID=UPI002739F575|nr:battenin isoform X5 [Poecile atricapillus]